MAIVYPEDRVDNGTVIDGRPVNRTLGKYAAEMGGLLDRDNFFVGAFTSAKVPAISGTNTATETNLQGPWHRCRAWRSGNVQTLLAGSATRGVLIEYVGGSIETHDSALMIDFGLWYHWSGVLGADYNVCEFYITVDGVVATITGKMGSDWEQHSIHLCAYVQVGAGTHNVKAYVSTSYYYYAAPPVHGPATLDLALEHRELIVMEVRR